MRRASVVVLLACLLLADACTDLLVSRGASLEGSTMITYAADSHVLFGALYHYPRATYPAGTMMKIHDWDTGVYLGEIPQAEETYNVVGNMNEYQVTVGESTYGGLEELGHQPGGIMDYGSLMWIALQRSKTAREAIQVISSLVAEYGYYSSGESFSIGDPNEVWIMEMIGKGAGYKGAVWVAMRIPDGYISGHANQARIRTFPLNDPNNCLYAPDVISFAREKGLYPAEKPDEEFSFSDIYNPVTFSGARGCESRVWSFFRKYVDGMDEYEDYVTGKNLAHRMPLYVKPRRLISVNDTMNAMRDHFEDSVLAFSTDVGAGPFELPYRWRPMDFTVGGKKYTNERSIATQQTGFSFVAQMRPDVPSPIGGILWFGVDDTAMSIYTPMYSCATRIPYSWAKQTADMLTFNMNSAFWVFNMISNWVYTRYSHMYPEYFGKIVEYENKFFVDTAKMDAQALAFFNGGQKDKAVELLTRFTETNGNQVVSDMQRCWQYLFVKYLDGNTKFPNPGHQNPIVKYPGYGAATYQRIVDETGDQYLVPNTPEEDAKLRLL